MNVSQSPAEVAGPDSGARARDREGVAAGMYRSRYVRRPAGPALGHDRAPIALVSKLGK